MSTRKYDAFIIFRGKGVYKGFVDQLYNNLKQNGIRVYRDDSDFNGITGNIYLHEYYKKWLSSIMFFYEKYGYHRYSLSEIAYILEFPFHKVSGHIYKFKPSVTEYQTGCFGEALAINEAANEAELHEWRKALSMVATHVKPGSYSIDTTNGCQSLIDGYMKRFSKMICDKSLGCKGFESISPSERRLSIFWDIENSPIPTDVIPEDIVKNTVAFVQRETEIKLEVDDVYAYGDFSIISNKQKVKLHNSGVTLIDTPCVKKDTTYNALLVALFKRARDCPPPYIIMLITGNIYFASALHALRRFGHNLFLAISSEVGVSTPLINASNHNWDWSNVAKGPTSSSQFQIEELPDDNYNWYPVSSSRSQINEVCMSCKWFESIRPLERRLFIVWDLENCSIPGEVHAKDVVKNIFALVKRETKIDWEVVVIFAYAEMLRIHRKVREYLERSGVVLIDTPHVKKDAADEAMIVDLFIDSYYFPPPSSIMVITGDVDFANPLHAIARFGHDIFLAIPSGVVSKSLTNASKGYWSWSDVANGIEERSHVDLTGLKGQLVELLESNGGQLPFGILPKAYQNVFRKPLRLSEYKAKKLVNLLEEMSDVISVEDLNGETLVKLKG